MALKRWAKRSLLAAVLCVSASATAWVAVPCTAYPFTAGCGPLTAAVLNESFATVTAALTSRSLTQTGGTSSPGVAGHYAFTDINTAGYNNGSFWFNDDISGTSLSGDRAAMVSVLNQSAPTASTVSPGPNYSGFNAYSQVGYNIGGTNSAAFGTSVGQNFGANIIAQLGPEATHWGGNVGLEVDVQHTIAGASVFKQVGIYSVKIGSVKGTLDAAFAVDAQSTYKWKTGLDLGLASNPYDTGSTLIGCLGCVTSVKNGIYMASVSFTDYALKLGSVFAVDGSGSIDAAGNMSFGGVLAISKTAPTISSGFGSSPSVSANNGTVAFDINVGSGGSATSGVIGLPTARTGWNCSATDITTNSATVFLTKQTASSTTSATVGNFNTSAAAAAWAANDHLRVSCFAY